MPLPRRPLLPLTAAALLALAAGCGSPAEPEEAAGCGSAPSGPGTGRPLPADLDGDGRGDLVAAFPAGGDRPEQGLLAVAPGGEEGPTPGAVRLLRPGAGVPDFSSPEAAFRAAAWTGDFDCDGYTDIAAVDHPGNGAGDAEAAPVLLWGGEDGGSEGAKVPVGEYADLFAVGDFDGDGSSDLLVYNPNDDTVGRVLPGPFGRDGSPAAEPLPGPRTDDAAEYRLIAGDLDGDGRDDLVGFGSFEEMAFDTLVWLAEDGGFAEAVRLTTADAGAIADVDGDGRNDLVLRDIGGTVEDPPWEPSRIAVFPGGPDGPAAEPSAELTLDSPGVPGEEADGDQFGAVLTAGDVDGDGRADVAASVNRPASAGPAMLDRADVVLLHGGPDGLTGEGAELLRPEDAGVEPLPGGEPAGPDHDPYDEIPRTGLRMLDTDGDGTDEIAVTTSFPADGGTAVRPAPIWFFRPGGDGGGSAPAPLAPEDLGSPGGAGLLAPG
ncbi:FG-GAP repeat protein [Nocardiopsis potens]|uniref:FG-GAP repeat protein n=1 Tax=Nocardiopsis potens TaxID=1246458 RepID=UPI00034DA4C1|nr:FG-GAP repeat protein [Nocardiopsis potens]